MDDQPEINQIMQDDMRQAAVDAQVVKETLQKQYEEKLKEAEAKDNTPGRGKAEFAPQGVDGTHHTIPGMKKSTHWLGPEAKAPDPDITLSDRWWAPVEGEELYERWKDVPDDHKRYIAAIGWGSETKDLLPPPDDATPELIDEYATAARKLVHSLVIQLGIEFAEEWWANPWRPSVMGSAMLTEEFATMVTKEAVYDPPRPTPVEAQDTINEHVMLCASSPQTPMQNQFRQCSAGGSWDVTLQPQRFNSGTCFGKQAWKIQNRSAHKLILS